MNDIDTRKRVYERRIYNKIKAINDTGTKTIYSVNDRFTKLKNISIFIKHRGNYEISYRWITC